MPSSKNYVRDHKQEYATQKARGESGTGPNSDNALRHKARRVMESKGLVKPHQDVDHKKPLSKGGSNDTKNLRAVSPSKNRSFKRNSDGSMK